MMESRTNSISVVARVSGSASDVGLLVSALSSLSGQLFTKPFTSNELSAVDAWWATEVTRESQESTEAVIKEVLDQLNSAEVPFAALVGDPRYRIEIDCTIEIERERPVLEVLPETLQRIAALGAALGFEVHDYRDD